MYLDNLFFYVKRGKRKKKNEEQGKGELGHMMMKKASTRTLKKEKRVQSLCLIPYLAQLFKNQI